MEKDKGVIDLDAQREQGLRLWKFFVRFVITGLDGNQYLIRWTLVGTPWFSVMLHKFLRSDADRCLHDHPWGFVSVILSGGYYEETPEGKFWRRPGSVLFRPAKWRHRVFLEVRERIVGGRLFVYTVKPWTLVIRGRRSRTWGFWTKNGWMKWTDFLGKGGGKC